MNDHPSSWNRLANAARHGHPQDGGQAPFGFSTRVVARWLAAAQPQPSAWEFLSLRSLGVAVVVMLVCVGINITTVREQFVPDPTVPAELFSLLTE